MGWRRLTRRDFSTMHSKEQQMFEYGKPSRTSTRPQKRHHDGDQRAEKAARRDRKAKLNRAREHDMMAD